MMQKSFDVFLSFRGEDVRKTFVSHLYVALDQKGINTFKDDEKLERGNSISPDLMRAIKKSRIALIIFSKNYANSTWCLDELMKIMECKNLKGQIVFPIFYDVSTRTVRKQETSYGEAFRNHEACFEDDKVQKWRAALEEAANLIGWDLPNTANGDEARVIKMIVGDIIAQLSGQTNASNTENLVGMELQMHEVYKMLDYAPDGVHFVGIWGMSGIGKTTLARAIYDNISSQFEGKCFLHEVRACSARQGLVRLQEILLSEILVMNDLRINNLFDGVEMLQKRLQYKKVLIVLDDVDHIAQLNALAEKREWFGPGSRIIITTKDIRLLVKHDVEKIYEMRTLSEYESLQLFKQYAFKKNHPTKEFEDPSARVIKHTAGLPLALKVLGNFLYGRDLAEWKSEVERLEHIKKHEILEKLLPSFTELLDIEQNIFLDIACFFLGKKKDSVIRILESFDFSPVIGIKVLMEKSLITISKGRIFMHQLIQEMGWHIVRQRASYRYSRLWMSEDIFPLLKSKSATGKIEGISLHLTNEEQVNVSETSFKQMTGLRFLKFRNVCLDPDFLPDELRWLDWHEYPSKNLPISFQGEQLVALKLKNSRIIQLWKSLKLLAKLKYINLSHSQKLRKTPDFSGTPNLKRLVLEECTSLVEINFSVSDLGQLVLLNLKNCRNLKTLPKRIRLEKLEVLILSGCSNLKSFPEIKEPGVGVVNREHLVSLPSLKTLDVSGCLTLKSLPDDLGLLVGLEQLHCTDTAIRTIPSSISLLKNLKHLSLRGSNYLGLQVRRSIFFPWLRREGNNSMGLNFHNLSGLCSLSKLDLSDCNISNGAILCNLGFLPCLEELNLDGNTFSSIPAASISRLTRLKVLALTGCRRLESFPQLTPSIKELYADECTSLKSIDQLTKYPMLHRLSLTKCHRLLENKSHSSMLVSLLNHMLEGLSMSNDRFSIYIPGVEIPEWFTYKNWGTNSISVDLPKNWCTTTFMGFAICAVFDRITTPTIIDTVNYLKTFQGLAMCCSFKRHDGSWSRFRSCFGMIGSEEPLDLGNTFLGYVSLNSVLSKVLEDMLLSPKDWIQFEFGIGTCRFCKLTLIKGLGVRLVYQNDINDPE